jgi:Mg-chelatase subunit ChlD
MIRSSEKKESRPIRTGSGGITRVALVLDRSGSMGAIREEARQAFNEAIDRVAEEAGKGGGATLTLVTFNHEVEMHLKNAPAKTASKLGPADYRPGGNTALYDAVGQAILALEDPGPLGPADAALVLVVTDGYENSSREVTQQQLAKRMDQLEKTDAWTFSFMCANVDIRDLSMKLGVDTRAMMSWTATEEGTEVMGHSLKEGLDRYFTVRGLGGRASESLWEEKKS